MLRVAKQICDATLLEPSCHFVRLGTANSFGGESREYAAEVYSWTLTVA